MLMISVPKMMLCRRLKKEALEMLKANAIWVIWVILTTVRIMKISNRYGRVAGIDHITHASRILYRSDKRGKNSM